MEKRLILDQKQILIKKKGNNTRITVENLSEPSYENIRFSLLNKEELSGLIQSLELFSTRPVTKESRPYIEEFSTYKNDIERSLFLNGSEIILSCYTDKDFDANWIELPPVKLSNFIGHLYGYLNL